MTPSELHIAPAVIVDLETTGFSVDHDRAIEIAAVRFETGRIVESFQSLLNPSLAIPPRVSRLTGIDDRMVRNAPSLEEALPRLLELLEGALLVAHNLPFDYGFLRRAAAVSRLELAPSRLCTLKLSRKVFRQLRSHRLEALAGELNLPTDSLHRALPHARLTAEIYERLLERADDETLLACLETGSVSAQPGVEDGVWKELPTGPGVYLLRDADGRVVYVGKSSSVRRRVREHLRQRWHPQPRLRRQIGRVTQVDVIETETDLEALFIESRLIKRYQPDGNSAERRERMAAFVAVDVSEEYPVIRVTDKADVGVERLFGPFGSRARLEEGLRALYDAAGLCTAGDPRRCNPVIPRHCLGPCALDRPAPQYGDAAFAALRLLRGEDHSLLDYLRQRRDHYADGLNFEAAAALRDRIFALERLVGDERWRRDVRDLNAIMVLPAEKADQRKLVLIRESRLAATERVSSRVNARQIRSILNAVYRPAGHDAETTSEVAEEMRLIQGWIRRVRDRHPLLMVDITRLDTAAEQLARTLGNRKALSSVRD